MTSFSLHRDLGLCFCLLGALNFAPAAKADDEAWSIPSIVVTPSRTPNALESVPESVSVVDRATIEQKGMVELQDTVADLPGVTLVRGSALGGTSSLFMRGTESSHTLVLLDGMPINNPADPAGSFNFGEDLLGSIDRIEVVRGPGSVMYGSNAIGGVVNLISRQPTNALEPELNVYGGNHGTGGGEGLVRGRDGKLGYVLEVEGEHTDGFNQLPLRLPNNRGDAKGAETTALFGKLTYDLDATTRLQSQIRWRDLNLALNDVPFDSRDYHGQSDAVNWQVRGEHDWLGHQAQSSITLGETQTHSAYRNNPDPLSEAAGSNAFNAAYDGAVYMANAQNVFHLPDVEAGELDKIKLITGVNYAREFADIDYSSNGIYGSYDQAARAATTQTGLFGEVQGRFLKRVDMTAGLRQDFPEAYADHTTERLGAVLQLPEIDGRIKSSYGTSYRTPSLFERYGVDNYGLIGNPNLKPETAQSWDAGIEKDFALFGKRKFASAGATYFETSTRNLIQYDFGPQTQYVNVARAEISGTESWIHTKPLAWLESDVNWTWLRSINASGRTFSSTPDGKPLLRRPQNTIRGSVTFLPTEVWRITPKLRYVSSEYDVLYDNSGTFTGRGRVGGYTLVDLATDYKLVDHISLYSTIRNLFDRTVESPNGYLQEPLTVMVGLKYQ